MVSCNVMVKSLPPQYVPGPCGGMAERLKAHVLKTCLGHTNVGSNPTPSAEGCRLTSWKVQLNLKPSNITWGGARVVEWGRLLSGYRGEILGRRFESCPPRHFKNAFREGRVFVFIQWNQRLQSFASRVKVWRLWTPELFQTQLHPQMRSLKSQPFIKAMGIDAGLVRR
jgi:hypothetical protein